MSYIPKEGDLVVHDYWGLGKVVKHSLYDDVMTVVFDKAHIRLHSGGRGGEYRRRCWNFEGGVPHKSLQPATLENV